MAESTRSHGGVVVPLPRVAIKFCIQCKWNLRAAYYAQELLQTFSLSLGEIALIPSTAGIFLITLSLPQPATEAAAAASQESQHAQASTPLFEHDPAKSSSPPIEAPASNQVPSEMTTVISEYILWDRKTDNGFPETKELKRRVRDLVDPGRGLGHLDRDRNRKLGEKGLLGLREEAEGEEGIDQVEEKRSDLKKKSKKQSPSPSRPEDRRMVEEKKADEENDDKLKIANETCQDCS